MLPRLDDDSRGAEIAQWLADNHAGQIPYVIIDDHADMLGEQKPHLVLCNKRDGFGAVEYLKALEILAPGHEDIEQLTWMLARHALGEPQDSNA